MYSLMYHKMKGSGKAFSTGTTFVRALTCDFQQCGILTRVDSDEPVQSPVKLRNSE